MMQWQAIDVYFDRAGLKMSLGLRFLATSLTATMKCHSCIQAPGRFAALEFFAFKSDILGLGSLLFSPSVLLMVLF
jgi:hypothetical protein